MSAAGRVVEVESDRLPGWVARFADRHGPVRLSLAADEAHHAVVVEADDGARAELAIPYGPLPDPAPDDLIADLVTHLHTPRTLGVLLVRRGGWAVAVVTDGRVTAADTGGGYVQGSTKAGGWSQQRYARRRSNQTLQVWDRAADGAAAVLGPHATSLRALVTGGDRAGVAAVLDDQRLGGLGQLVEPRFFAVGDPKRAVLDDVARRLRSVAITLNELA